MMTTLDHRIERLERQRGMASRYAACPECGLRRAPGDIIRTPMAVVFGGGDDDAAARDAPTRCLRCGRLLVLVVEFDPRN